MNVQLPRLQLLELNDTPWVPRALRDTIVEALSRTLEWGHLLAGVVTPFEEFVARSGAREVLDVCAGAGGPAVIFAREIRRAGRVPPRLVLTDLHPHVEAWQAAQAAAPEDIAFEPTPVDATAIPAALARGRARVIINALHHFPPALAAGILRDGVAEGSAGIFVAELFDRNPLRFASLLPFGLPALLANPLLTRRDRLAKLVLTASPVVPLAALWDGIVSAMRMYSRAELFAMVAPLGEGIEWVYGRHRFGRFGNGYYFYGVPRK